jgi:hypothetical protein
MADLTDIETLHAFGGFENPTEEQNALLEKIISAASALAEDHCNRKFAPDSTTVPTVHTFSYDSGLLDRAGGRTLWLDEDLCTVYSISPTPTGTLTMIPAIAPYSRIVLSEGSWADGTAITGFWAYAMACPAEIEQVVLRLCLFLWRQKDADTFTSPDAILAELDHYIKPRKA